mgnify:CR=1 FL=1
MTDLDGAVTINESSADADFRIESDNLENALFVQGSDGRVGLNTNSPAYGLLDVRQTGTGAQDRCLWLDMAPASSGSNNNAMVINVGNANMTNTVMRIHHESPAANQKLISLDTTGSNTEKFWVDEDGDAYLAGFLEFPDGSGIHFGASQGSGSTSEKLDDYEEGTYSPTFTGSSATGSQSYSYQNGWYVKVGSLVTAFFDMNISSSSGMSGAGYISLPIASKNQNWYAPMLPWEVATNFTDSDQKAGGYVQPSAAVVVAYKYNSENSVLESSGYFNINVTGRISGQVTYQAA